MSMRRSRCIVWMLRGRRSCFSTHSEAASAASAHAQSTAKLYNSPNIGRIKKTSFQKNIYLSIGKYSLERNLKSATQKFSTCVTLMIICTVQYKKALSMGVQKAPIFFFARQRSEFNVICVIKSCLT